VSKHKLKLCLEPNVDTDMKIVEFTLPSVNTHGGGEIPPSIGLIPDALPEVQGGCVAKDSQTGVSTKNALLETVSKRLPDNENDVSHWYALRTTYGREKKAYDYMVAKGVTAFYPTKEVVKLIRGKRKVVTESRLPNMFFAYGTEDQIKAYVYDNINLPFLRFYYRHVHVGRNMVRRIPLIVPDNQVESLRIICAAEGEDVIVANFDIPKFETGQMVKVIDGEFKGVQGRVARFQGQQRVGVVIEGLITVISAYVPKAFLETIHPK